MVVWLSAVLKPHCLIDSVRWAVVGEPHASVAPAPNKNTVRLFRNIKTFGDKVCEDCYLKEERGQMPRFAADSFTQLKAPAFPATAETSPDFRLKLCQEGDSRR